MGSFLQKGFKFNKDVHKKMEEANNIPKSMEVEDNVDYLTFMKTHHCALCDQNDPPVKNEKFY